MELKLQIPDPSQSRRRKSLLAIVFVAIVLVMIVAPRFLSKPRSKTPATAAPGSSSMSADEQRYLPNLRVGNVTLSRAENFIHQEVTIVNGEVLNMGKEPVSGIRLTIEFSDNLNQLALRETRAIAGAAEAPLAPGAVRSFEISFEHVPDSWNMQQPAIRVASLQLAGSK